MEEAIVEHRYGDGTMMNIKPDRNMWLYRSKIMLSGCSGRDINRIRRFILRRCSEGGQLTSDQFLTYYSQIDYLDLYGLLSTMFRLNGSEKISVSKTGLEYLAVLDDLLGKEVDCEEDGEPIVKIYGKTLISMEDESDE